MKQSFNLKTMFTLFLAAPFIVLIVMIFIFMGIAESRNSSSGPLEAPKYLLYPLTYIIEHDFKPPTDPKGVILILDSAGKVIYSQTDIGDGIDIDKEDTASMLAQIVLKGSTNMSISHYKYNDEPYFCFFDNAMFPAIYKQQMRVGISLFIIIISILGLVFGQISTVIINSSIKKLIDASDRIAEGNLEESINLKYDNEFVHVANAIDRMRVELKEKRNVEQRFVMSVTHDLKTPLTSIQGYLEALSDGVITNRDEVASTVELMQKKASLLDSRINELLDYSRSRTAGWRENWKEINMSTWLQDISSMFRNDASLCGRNYLEKINIDEDTILKGDDKLLSRAFENLFDNACRYTEPGDYIIFSADQREKAECTQIELVFEDSGSGISEENLDKIFELFYRNDRGRNSRGMGIGLASVQTIINDHGGTIQCSNSESGGARFTVILEV
ncbi:signal transduction histidine kinase [Spirochaeta isovalerica]|uniref:Signal transduction histidine-protein kinase/phosphatase MprB n=2 Tax=Spirochaeta isovalerica TaxID=150 RepID=A0A841R7Y3_9SPIO|nr:signal transduction histidine kinase [Spirochaeta isovalerica]